MRIVILVLFWLHAVSLFIKVGQMAANDYPRKKEYSLGYDAAYSIICIIYLAVFACALWLHPN